MVVFSFGRPTWQAGAVTAGVMTVVSYIFWGVAPRTLGRQHARAGRLLAAPARWSP